MNGGRGTTPATFSRVELTHWRTSRRVGDHALPRNRGINPAPTSNQTQTIALICVGSESVTQLLTTSATQRQISSGCSRDPSGLEARGDACWRSYGLRCPPLFPQLSRVSVLMQLG